MRKGVRPSVCRRTVVTIYRKGCPAPALIWAWERSIGDYIGVDPAVAQALRYRGPKHWDQCIADTAYEIAMRWQSKPLRANGLDSDIEPPNGIRDATAED